LPAAPAPQAAASVAQAPPVLLQLPAGSSLPATVTQALSQGSLTIDTPLGELTLKTPLPLPVGSSLNLQMTGSSADTALLRITSMDGKPLGQALTDMLAQGRGLAPSQNSTNTPLSGTVNGLSTPVATGPSLTTPFQATVLRGGPLAPGSELTVRLTALNSTSAQPGATPGNALTPNPGNTAPLATGQNGASAAPNSSLSAANSAPAAGGTAGSASAATGGTALPAGGQGATVANPALNISQGGALSATPHPNSQGHISPNSLVGQNSAAHKLVGQTVTGTVASNSAGGTTMVRSDAGLLALSGKVDLPVGARITLDVVAQNLPPSQASQALPPLSGALQGVATGSGAAPSAWPTLGETLDFLGRVDPQAARQLAALIPSNDPRMVANAVAFNQAIRSNEPGRWLPPSVTSALDKAGEKGRQLSERLNSDLRELATRSKRPNPGGNEWRTLAMPFMDGGAISQVNVITRRLGPEEDNDERGRKNRGGGQGQRFLIDLSLSNLGDLQFDGLYKKKVRTLELIVRSRRDLPGPIRQAINGLFANSSQVLNISGGVNFRVTDQFAGPPPGAGAAISQADADGLPDTETLTVPVVPSGGWTV
jgi:hypothetical protein